MRRQAAALHRGEGGQAIVLIAITLLGLIMMVGLAIDAGQLYVARRTAQEAADAAAYAGAVVHYERTLLGEATDSPLAIQAAVSDAALNGFVHGVESRTVVARIPQSGLYVNNSRYVEVLITENVRTSIVPGGGLTMVAVRAVAGAESLNNQYAIMALDRTPAGPRPALNVENTGRVDLRGGGILVNSTRVPAADNDANGVNVTFAGCTPACYTDVAGTAEGQWPNLRTGQPQEPDPFAGTVPPSIPACARNGNTSCLYNALPSGATVTLQPGVYTTRIQYASTTTIIFKPGVYILKDGIDLAGTANAYTTDKSGSPSPAATCVMSASSDCGIHLFNTVQSYPSPGGTCGPIRLVGSAAVKLSAKNSDPYKNFLVFQDAACTAEMKIGGSGVFEGNGTVYLPSAQFLFDGNNATLTGSQLVAKTVQIQTGNIAIDFTAANVAQPILPRLSE